MRVSQALAYSLDFRDLGGVNIATSTDKGYSVFTLRSEMAQMLACSYGKYLFTPQARMRVFRRGAPSDLKLVAKALSDLGYAPGRSALTRGRFSQDFYNALVAYYDDKGRKNAPIWVTKRLVKNIGKEAAEQ